MAITIEIDGLGARAVDTVLGASDSLLIKQSVTVTQWVRHRITIADGATATIQFDGISAKVVVVKTSGALTLKINAEATGHVVNGVSVLVDSGGSFTAGTLANTSGGALTADVLLGG